MARPTQIIINLTALQHNWQYLRKCAPHTRVIAMVKANAYGHGLIRIARALPHADAFGVATLTEGIYLRQVGIKQPIILMEGVFDAAECKEAIEQHFTLVIHHTSQLEYLIPSMRHLTDPIQIWLKINTGMNRLGIAPNEVKTVYQTLYDLPMIAKPIGLMTHLAEAEDQTSNKTSDQLDLFNHLTAGLPQLRSAANSAAILHRPDAHYDWIRPGLMLYGASPCTHAIRSVHPLQPVMQLQSALIAIQQVKPGEQVGYGSTWTASRAGVIGIAAIGYGDGYPQQAPCRTPVLVEGITCYLAGRVSMDMLAIDLSHHPNACIGAKVILWGQGLPVEQVARCCHTSAYELLTRLTQRPEMVVK